MAESLPSSLFQHNSNRLPPKPHPAFKPIGSSQSTQSDLAAEVESLIIYDEDDIDEGIKKCTYSIVGKLITDKQINPIWIQNAMSNIWKKPQGFHMKEIQPKLYQFFFDKETDMRRALKGNPWILRNSWLLVKQWERNLNPAEMDFSAAELNVQMWNMPERCKTVRLGRKVAALMGEVLECNLFDGGSGLGTFVKARVSMKNFIGENLSYFIQ
ncbi:hypothetical protein PIB30_118942 [Stylosanthes scabra]|uniref:DUF4283 domain-containing protein n=1 Tax=Stylosanthes scabra TaxID=79078 RepID=A0ABU6S9B6_9FABA|nr:hypothetical protein [Stylosanthes scabra]